MIAIPSSLSGPATSDQFVISHGKSGAVGVFTASEPLPLRRGEQVLVRSFRGVEPGRVLCPATLRQARMLGATSQGELLRPFSAADESTLAALSNLEKDIFEKAREWNCRDDGAMEILDVELLFEGKSAIVQFVGEEAGSQLLAPKLEAHFGIDVVFENLALPLAEDENATAGCDKPDCGRSAGGSGCTSCGTGGGCSSCGSAKVDLREYFGHLRTNLETKHRIPLA